MQTVKQSTESPFVGEMRLINGVVKEWDGKMWVSETWHEKQATLKRLGYYFETEEEFDNFMELECEYEDELRIRQSLVIIQLTILL